MILICATVAKVYEVVKVDIFAYMPYLRSTET